MENQEVITRTWIIIHEALEGIKEDETYSIALYGLLLELLPMTTLINKINIKNKKVIISGMTQLSYNWELKRLKVKEQDRRLLYFDFCLNDEASVKAGYRNPKPVFSGNWLETLGFIVSQIKDSGMNAKLSKDKRAAFEDFILALAKPKEKKPS
jgi:hypothetical protein